MKSLLAAITSMSLVACAMPERPPTPTGPSKPVNSLATTEMLAYQAGLVLVGPQRNKPAVKEQLLYNGQPLSANPSALWRQLFRARTRDEYAQVPGAEFIERVVIVPFTFGSAKFQPSPEQQFQLRQLLAVADRVEVRGRTDGRGNKVADERMAHRRAEAAKRYLLDRGVPSSIIAVNYQAAGDYIADNERTVGRGMNRRVELEFYIDDFTAQKVREYSTGKCNQPVNFDEWQVVDQSNNHSGCIN